MKRTLEREDLGHEAVLAIEAVAVALRVARTVEREATTGRLTKDDTSPVTVADFSVQAVVASQLARHFPDDPLVAEEDGSVLRTAADLLARVTTIVTAEDASIRADRVIDCIDRGGGQTGRRFWTLDPIDGTKGLLRGGQYVVALAL